MSHGVHRIIIILSFSFLSLWIVIIIIILHELTHAFARTQFDLSSSLLLTRSLSLPLPIPFPNIFLLNASIAFRFHIRNVPSFKRDSLHVRLLSYTICVYKLRATRYSGLQSTVVISRAKILLYFELNLETIVWFLHISLLKATHDIEHERHPAATTTTTTAK